MSGQVPGDQAFASTVALAAAGDKAAFARLVATHHADMARVAFVICGDRALAEDAVQSAWLVAWRKLRSLRNPERVRPWLLKVTANETRQLVRRRHGPVVEIDVEVPGDRRSDPSNRVERLDVPIVLGDVAIALAQAGAIGVSNSTGIPDPPDNDDEGVRFLGDHGALVRAQAEALACAIRFARARATELGSDDPIVVHAGFSAGGGIAAHVALFGVTLEERWDEFAVAVGGPPRQVECVVADGSTHVDALVSAAGTYDFYVPVIEGKYGRTYQQAFDPELQQFLASAIGANPELVVRLFHGTSDEAIPATVSEDFAAALADAGYDVQFTTFDGGHVPAPAELSLPVYKELLGL